MRSWVAMTSVAPVDGSFLAEPMTAPVRRYDMQVRRHLRPTYGGSAVGRSMRFSSDDGAFAAEMDGRLVGCGFVMNWGSVGILGPLTVDVDLWSCGIARAMMPAMIDYMDREGFAVQGLLTHPQSPKHIRLYEAFGFRMDLITGVMDKTVDLDLPWPDPVRLYSELSEAEREQAIVVGEIIWM